MSEINYKNLHNDLKEIYEECTDIRAALQRSETVPSHYTEQMNKLLYILELYFELYKNNKDKFEQEEYREFSDVILRALVIIDDFVRKELELVFPKLLDELQADPNNPDAYKEILQYLRDKIWNV